MITAKKYLSIKEVSQLLNIKEHVIRHWDSVDPKTKKLRIEGLSFRTNGGTRYFNKAHIKKITNLNNLLKSNGKRNYSLDLASKIMNRKTLKNNKYINNEIIEGIDSRNESHKLLKIKNMTDKLRKLLITK